METAIFALVPVTACSVAQVILASMHLISMSTVYAGTAWWKFANEAAYAVNDENAVAEDNFILFLI